MLKKITIMINKDNESFTTSINNNNNNNNNNNSRSSSTSSSGSKFGCTSRKPVFLQNRDIIF